LSANRVQHWMRWSMAAFYLCAGFIHLQLNRSGLIGGCFV